MPFMLAHKPSVLGAAPEDPLRSIDTLCGALMAHNSVVERLVHGPDAQPGDTLDAQIRQLQAHTAALRRLCQKNW